MTKQWIFTSFAHYGHTNILFRGHFTNSFGGTIIIFSVVSLLS